MDRSAWYGKRRFANYTINGNVFSLCGEKRIERESHDRYLPDTNTIYHIYGAFQRAITPPRDVNTDKAKATYR